MKTVLREPFDNPSARLALSAYRLLYRLLKRDLPQVAAQLILWGGILGLGMLMLAPEVVLPAGLKFLMKSALTVPGATLALVKAATREALGADPRPLAHCPDWCMVPIPSAEDTSPRYANRHAEAPVTDQSWSVVAAVGVMAALWTRPAALPA